MIENIHKRSLQASLLEHEKRLDKNLQKILILASLSSLFILVFCMLKISTLFIFLFIPISTYCLYSYFQFYHLWKTKNKILKELK